MGKIEFRLSANEKTGEVIILNPFAGETHMCDLTTRAAGVASPTSLKGRCPLISLGVWPAKRDNSAQDQLGLASGQF